MGNIGGGEVLVILLAALIILGPSKLPDVARQMGKAMAELRKVTNGFQRELHDAMNAADESDARRRGEAVAATRPSTTVPSDAVPSDAVPPDTVPPAAVPPDTVPGGLPDDGSGVATSPPAATAGTGETVAGGAVVDDHH